MKHGLLLFGLFLFNVLFAEGQSVTDGPYIQILGIAQDAGYPQINCQKSCCTNAWEELDKRKWVASIALVLPLEETYYIIDASPDLKDQMRMMSDATGYQLGGIFLTHAHIGHYTGLMDLGREAMGARDIPVYAMPRMTQFLKENGPWSQLVSLNNIRLLPLEDKQSLTLHSVHITPHQVPHRDEFSETVGYEIVGPKQSAWYIPDIDKWNQWEKDLLDELDKDYLIVDGTFYRNGEIWGRDMSEIPHPFVIESMDLFEGFSEEVKSKVIFTHFNHTNPLLWDEQTRNEVRIQGFKIAERGMILPL